MQRFKTDFSIEVQDKGPTPNWQGHDEAEYYQFLTKELASWIDDWEVMDTEGKWDKVIMGYGGPILRERRIKIQRMPFIVPEAVVSPCHMLPAEVLVAIDEWTWAAVRSAKTVHITDPEGTAFRFTNHNAYWSDEKRVNRRVSELMPITYRTGRPIFRVISGADHLSSFPKKMGRESSKEP